MTANKGEGESRADEARERVCQSRRAALAILLIVIVATVISVAFVIGTRHVLLHAHVGD
jgi:hypothetical protein